MFCQVCGTNNSDDSRFCVNCGADLTAQNVVEETTEPAVEVNNVEVQPQEPVYVEQPQYTQPVVVQEEKGKGLAIASLICGIVSLFCCPLWLASILAIVFGAIAKSKGCKSGMATAGIILGVIGLVASIILTIVVIALVGFLSLMTATAIETAAQTPYYY